MQSYDKAALAQAVLAAMTVVAGTAGAQTLYGGGATLPAPGYVGPNNAISSSRLTTPDELPPDSLFGAYTDQLEDALVQYCQTGSGTGKNVFTGSAGVAADFACPPFSVTPIGFGAPSGQVLPDFAASDSPVAAGDITNFYANPSVSAHVAPVQVPAIAAAVAVILNNPDVSGTPNITTSQICQVFSGGITDWSSLTQADGKPFPSRAITAVYRSDGSGTTFNFSNHLSAVCPADGVTGFFTSQNWTGTPSASVVGTLSPTNQVGASGNPGVVTAVANTTGAIGYAEYADAIAINPNVPHFTVDNEDPTDLVIPPSLTFTTGQVIATADNANGTPVLQAVSTADTHPECLLLVNPTTYSNPMSGYSIIAVTYLLGYYAGNGSNTQAVSDLLSSTYNDVVKNAAKQIAPSNGYAFLVADPTATIKSCVNN